MKSTPAGWPRITASVFYDDPRTAIDWLCRAFGFEVRLRVEDDDGTIVHSELAFGDGIIMVGGTGHGERPEHQLMVSPRSTKGGNTQNLAVYVDDADAHYARAKSAGAKIFRELETNDYGDQYASDRVYGALDPEDHQWFFMQRMRDPKKAKG